jgi:hypothetical protein
MFSVNNHSKFSLTSSKETTITSNYQQTNTDSMINTPTDNLEFNCSNIIVVPQLHGQGKLITHNNVNDEMYLYDLVDGKILTLGTLYTSISIYHGKIAFIDYQKKKLFIVNANNEIIFTLPSEKEWSGVIDWLNDHEILIEVTPRLPNGGWHPPSSTITLDINNGTIAEILSKYPNIYNSSNELVEWGKYSFTRTIYNKKFTLVAYLSEQKSFQIILWDIIHNLELTHLSISDQRYQDSTPVWRQDDEEFVTSVPLKITYANSEVFSNLITEFPYSGGNEIVSVSKDGIITRLTYLTIKYYAEESSLSWSYNMQYIAFWMKLSQKDEWSLSILDRYHGKIVNYCIHGGDGSMPIYWTRDNMYIYTTYFGEMDQGHIIKLDLLKNEAENYQSNEPIEGWIE